MTDIRVQLVAPRELVEEEVVRFAMEWDCDIKPAGGGWLLLPEYMYRIYGVFVLPADGGWTLQREQEATTWEDFLQVLLAHTLARTFGGTLYYGNREEPVEVAPEKFLTFDHYVETVLENEPDWVKETKRHWMYTHKKRALR